MLNILRNVLPPWTPPQNFQNKSIRFQDTVNLFIAHHEHALDVSESDHIILILVELFLSILVVFLDEPDIRVDSCNFLAEVDDRIIFEYVIALMPVLVLHDFDELFVGVGREDDGVEFYSGFAFALYFGSEVHHVGYQN